ncbi:hypothetical protein FJZ48_00935, partial [Candidatus Uhrbacteria bacterium]|nr:hypothetical protein [Candidatus Uhrbacteria bacterium]
MNSLFRRLTHQALASLFFSGKVLDLGGARLSAYRTIIEKTADSITVVNLDPSTQPDVMANLEEPFPCETQAFDTVLALNVLEHIYA